MLGIELSASIIWIVIGLIFIAIEIFTLNIITIWFAIGAFITAIIANFTESIAFQFILFLLSSALLLYFTRPIFEKYLKIGKEKTNAESLIGEIATIIEPVFPNQTGQAKVRGQIWSCEGENNRESFDVGELVLIENIIGVRLIVKRKEV